MTRGTSRFVRLALTAVWLAGCDEDPARRSPRPVDGGCDGGACESTTVCTGSTRPTLCSGECVDLKITSRHCGECGHACQKGATCRDGTCACSATAPDDCNGECVDTKSDSRHCGKCGSACGATCRDGVCIEATDLALGGQHALARLSDGSLAAWGYNGFGQLGTGKAGPPAMTPQPLSDPKEVSAVTAGRSHTCVVLPDHTVACWGDNAFGQLLTDSLSSAVPLTISGVSDVSAISAGGRHTCALGTGGSVTCWGWNRNGQLGDGTTNALVGSPVTVSGISKAREVVAGANHSCALRDDGAVLCWGDNADGQLGDGTTAIRPAPVPVTGIVDAVEITAGAEATCARTNAGAVLCWGREGAAGSIDAGDAAPPMHKTAVAVSGVTTAAGIAAGDHHVCARLMDGTAVCWGDNRKGQLGDGSKTASSTPVVVSGATDVAEIAAGGDHSCLRRSDGAVQCWGDNAQGELGDGTTTPKSVPISVVWK